MRISLSSSRNGSVGIAGRIFGSLFGLVFASFGFFFLWGGTIQPLLEKSETKNWVEVPATITESTVTGSGDSLKNVIRFEYQYKDYANESDRAHLNPPKLSISEVQRLRDELSVGETTAAYVNPKNPQEAVLFLNAENSVFIGLFSLPFILIGLGVAGFSLFGKSKKAKSQGFSKRPSRGPLGKRNLVLSLFGIPFFAAGAGFCWFGGISPLLKSQEAQDWPEVPCTITESYVESHSSSDGTTYSIEIRFNYEWKGKDYYGENYTFGNTSSSGRPSKKAVVRRYPEGSQSTCFVNPDDPYEAVITTDVGWLPIGLIGFSSIFILVGGGLIVFGFRRKKDPGPNAVLPEEDSFGGPNEVRELKPVTGRIARAAGAVIVAVIWNGISSIPLAIYFSQGNGETMLLIIGLIFAAVGIFLIFTAIRALLALRNPLPIVMVAPGRIQPGTRMILSWKLEGSISRLNNLEVYLEGIEIAQYQRGTNTVTDRNVFFQECLFTSTEKGSFQTGSSEFPFPGNTVPSMKSDHNEILWQLVFIGDVPRWPDLSETYRLPIAPVRR
ncbi:hypothetical protein J3R74_002386 [Puniceicoccus vermicola]